MIHPLDSQKGAVLIILIVAIVLGGLVGGAVYTLTATSALNELTATMLNRAQFLAESGVRYAFTQGNASGTYTMANAREQFIVGVPPAPRTFVSTGVVNAGTPLEARKVLTYRGDMGRRPTNQTFLTLTFETLGGLDTTNTAGRLEIGSYTATGGHHAYWAAFYAIGNSNYRFRDPEDNECWLGYLVAPVASDRLAPLRQDYSNYGTVSYDVQVKIGWLINMPAAVSGINFRWHEHPSYPGKYQGYGLSFMIMGHRNCQNTNWDYIPNSIKPPDTQGNDLRGKVLLVLWEQRVVSGVERKRWLAYAILGDPGNHNPNNNTNQMNDPMVVGNQGWPDGLVNDNASLMIRIEDMFSPSGQRLNQIKVYYGDASANDIRTSGLRGANATATDIYRLRYYPQWLERSGGGQLPNIFPRWGTNYFISGTDQATTRYWAGTWNLPAKWEANTAYVAGSAIMGQTGSLVNKFSALQGGLSGSNEPSWPQAIGDTVRESGGSRITWEATSRLSMPDRDYFSLQSQRPVSVASKQVTLIFNPDATDIQPLSDGATLRTYDFVLSSFPVNRKEIGIHAMGKLTRDNDYSIGFDDLAAQILGEVEQ